MPYQQITHEERYQLGQLLCARLSVAAMARLLGRHRSTIHRELARNRSARRRYEWYHANCLAVTRRSHSRRNRRLTPAHWAIVEPYLAEGWSPEQIAGRWQVGGRRWISHEAIYQYLYRDRTAGGVLHRWLPQGRKTRRRRFGRKRLGGPRGRSITERPAIVGRRTQIGHWEIDTVQGPGRACLVTAVERATGYAVIGKLEACTTEALVRRLTELLRDQPHPIRTITADNGSEMTGYRYLEQALQTRFYFTQPYSAWQRGSIEHLNGLIRRVYPKGTDFTQVTQLDCTRLARQLNQRPRRRFAFRTPEECYEQ
jgi:IS30 family transposase